MSFTAVMSSVRRNLTFYLASSSSLKQHGHVIAMAHQRAVSHQRPVYNGVKYNFRHKEMGQHPNSARNIRCQWRIRALHEPSYGELWLVSLRAGRARLGSARPMTQVSSSEFKITPSRAEPYCPPARVFFIGEILIVACLKKGPHD